MLFNMRLRIYRVGMYGFTKSRKYHLLLTIYAAAKGAIPKGNGTLQLFITKNFTYILAN